MLAQIHLEMRQSGIIWRFPFETFILSWGCKKSSQDARVVLKFRLEGLHYYCVVKLQFSICEPHSQISQSFKGKN